MRRFRDLLMAGASTTPMEEQRRASAQLADTVSLSNFRWWQGHPAQPPEGSWLLVAVAPYSQYDLTLLDILDESIGSGRAVLLPLYVANLLDYQNAEQVRADFRGCVSHRNPVVSLWDAASHVRSESGKRARDLLAETLHLDGEALQQRILEESPRFTGLAKH